MKITLTDEDYSTVIDKTANGYTVTETACEFNRVTEYADLSSAFRYVVLHWSYEFNDMSRDSAYLDSHLTATQSD